MIKARRMRWGDIAYIRQRRGTSRVLKRETEGKSSLGRPRRIWEDNIEMDLQEVRWESINWIDLAQNKAR
jgi:hypothetical protein